MEVLGSMFLTCLLCVLLAALATALYVLYQGRVWRRSKRRRSIGFFHPYTNDGGGGERVLWFAVKVVQEERPQCQVVIYTGDDATPESLAERAFSRFGVTLPRPVQIVLLYRRAWVEASSHPRLTILGQSLGSMVLGWEALSKFVPAVFVDTSGYAFTYPLACLAGCAVACYTHYPTVSTDMLQRVANQSAMYNNDAGIAKSRLLSLAKVFYYRAFALLYGAAGSCAQVVMVNSSWTEGHIRELWGKSRRISRVYPPCNTTTLQKLPLARPPGNPYIISVAQFRPEKAHPLQLEAFALALEKASDKAPDWHLKLVGSCRHGEDEQRIAALRKLALDLGIADRVDLCVNVKYEELVSLLGGAVAGLHTMIDEHFGIVVVEYMAAGAIPIAHNSAGPRQDIVCTSVTGTTDGFLATSREEYAEAICQVMTLDEHKRLTIASAARERSRQFSDEVFETRFEAAIRGLLQ